MAKRKNAEGQEIDSPLETFLKTRPKRRKGNRGSSVKVPESPKRLPQERSPR